MTDKVVTPQKHLHSIVKGVEPYIWAKNLAGAIEYVTMRLAQHPATEHNKGTTVTVVLMPAWECGPEEFKRAILRCNVRSTKTSTV